MQLKFGQHTAMSAFNVSTKFDGIPSRHRKWTFWDPRPSGWAEFRRPIFLQVFR